MRPVLVGACVGLLALSSGCSQFNKTTGVGAVTDVTPRWGGTPKPEQLVATLNQNAQSVQSLEAQKVFITAKVNNEHQGGIQGFLACQKAARPGTPANFRLQGEVVGSAEVDVGSNSQEFWFWLKHSPQPYVYYCSYADFPKVAARGAMPFPFQPEWVVEALGMAEYDPHQKYEVSDKAKDTYDLIQRTRSPRGTEVVKVVAFHKVPRPGQSPVAAYMLYETTNDAKRPYRELCSAVIDESQAVPVGGGKTAVMPSVVRLHCPQENTELKIELGKVQVNVPFDQERSGFLFTRRSLQSYKSYDLARALDPAPNGVRPAGGIQR